MSWIFDTEEFLYWWLKNFDNNPYFPCICVLIWTVGMLGNLASLIVFSSKQSFINSLFYWLAICDFLELVLLGTLVFNSDFMLIDITNNFASLYLSNEKYSDMIAKDPIFLIVVLLIFFHNISILLNITLAFSQYLMVVHPLKYRQLFSSRQSSKRKIIGSIFIINFVFSTLMFLSSLFDKEKRMIMEMKFNESGDMYVYSKLGKISNYSEIINSIIFQEGPFYWNILNGSTKIYHINNEDNSAIVLNSTSAIYSVLYEDPSDKFKENFTIDYMDRRYQKLFFFNESIDSIYNKTGKRFKLDKRISLIYYFRESLIFGSWIDILNCIIIRLGLLIVLMVACIGLIFGILQVRRKRHKLIDSVRTLNQPRSMDSVTNQMINMTLVIVFIFTIAEVPILVIFNTAKESYSCKVMFFDYYNTIGCKAYSNCNWQHPQSFRMHTFSILTSIILFISSSYTIFCYLIMNVQYRKTLKHILYNIYKSLKKFFCPPCSIQWGYRATYQETPQTFELR